MSSLLDIKEVDQRFYLDKLQSFLPERILDIHTHVWLDGFTIPMPGVPLRAVTWPWLVASQQSVEELLETYKLMFPGKQVTPLMFSKVSADADLVAGNQYVREHGRKHDFPTLMVARPEQGGAEFESAIEQGGFLGCKVYLNYAPSFIPEKEIRIYDFLPRHQLDVLNKRGWMAMLHIPRDGRLKDPLNLAQLLEIERDYPDLKLIVAHVGRAYCREDLGNALELLSETRNMVFDFSANTNEYVFQQLIKAVGPRRILFGSDLPIVRMRMKRIYENGMYLNVVKKGMYGDVSGDKNMREIEGPEAEELSFFLYEQIDAFRLAAKSVGLTRQDIEDVFYNNAARIIQQAKERNG